jgi:hypothetical protein
MRRWAQAAALIACGGALSLCLPPDVRADQTPASVPTSAPTSAPPSADQDDGGAVFAEIRNTWFAMTYPRLVNYSVVVTTIANGVAQRATYNGQAQPLKGDFRVNAFSVEEEREPYVPTGTSFRLDGEVDTTSGSGIGGDLPIGDNRANHPVQRVAQTEAFAIPEVSPLYAFGMRTCRSRSASPKDQSPLRVIGVSSSVARRYRITVDGTDLVDGKPALHVSFEPLIDAKRDRLREVWIDPKTSHVLAATVLGNFIGSAESTIPWRITFREIDGSTYIDKETAEAPLRRGRTVYDHVEIRFQDIQRTHGFPNLDFAMTPDYQHLDVVTEPDDPRGSVC